MRICLILLCMFISFFVSITEVFLSGSLVTYVRRTRSKIYIETYQQNNILTCSPLIALRLRDTDAMSPLSSEEIRSCILNFYIYNSPKILFILLYSVQLS